MTKSLKYNVIRESKYKYPTRSDSTKFVIGKDTAKKAIESRLKRSLKEGTKIDDNLGQWIFREPK